MAAPFRLAPGAEEQVGDIVAFIAADSEEAAVRVRNAFHSAFGLLAKQPELGHTRADLTNRPVKFWSRTSSCTTRRVRRSPSWPYCTALATSSSS